MFRPLTTLTHGFSQISKALSPFVQMSPKVSRIRNDNGCLRGENPSLSAFKSPSLYKEKAQRWFIAGKCFYFDAHESNTCTESFNPVCRSKRLPVWELTIKMMACSITILSSITLTSVLWAVWYFQGPRDPSPLTPQLL